MIVDRASKVIILGNRKCASTTLYNLFSPLSDFRNNPFIGKPGSYDSVVIDNKIISLDGYQKAFFYRHFKHFDALQAKFFIEQFCDMSFDQFRVLFAIRHPYERLRSEFKYHLRITKQSSIENDMNTFVLKKRDLSNDCASRFSFGVSKQNLSHVKVETLQSDLDRVFKSLDLNSYLSQLKKSKLPKLNVSPQIESGFVMEFSTLTKEFIFKNFRSDFNLGQYSR